MVLARHKINQDVLARRVVGPVDLPPRHVHLVGAALAERVLPKEEHEARAVLVHGPALCFHQAEALDHVDELDLLVARQLRQSDPGQLLADPPGHVLVERLAVVVVRRSVGEVRVRPRIRGRLAPMSAKMAAIYKACSSLTVLFV